MGTIQEVEYNGQKYFVYIPENCDANTSLVYYAHGAGYLSDDKRAFDEFINEGGSLDSIVVFSSSISVTDSNLENISGYINSLIDEYGISLDNVSFSGFSSGGNTAQKTFLNFIGEHPEAEANLVYIDSVWPNYLNDYLNAGGSLEGKTIIDVIGTGFAFNGDCYVLKNAYEAGATVYTLKGNQNKTHPGENANFFKYALSYLCNRNCDFPITDYFTVGKYGSGGVLKTYSGELTDEERAELNAICEELASILRVDQDPALIYQRMVSEVQGLNEKYFGSGSEWKWNNDVLAGELQDLVSKVSSLEYMKSEVLSAYESTTELPNAEAEKQQLLYANVTALLSNIDQIIEAAYMIQDSIQVTEKTKAEEASELDVGGSTTSSSSGLGFFDRAKATWNNIVEKAYDWLHPDPKFELPGFLGKLQRGMQEAHHGFDELIWGILGYDVPPLEDKNKVEEVPEKEPEKQEETPKTPEPEKPSSNTGGGYHGGGGGGSSGGGGSTPSPEDNVEEQKIEYDIKTDFPEWDDVYTDDNRLVYESEEGYKVVIHHNQEEIIGVEHYYDFKTEESAKENYDKVINDYINEDYSDVIIRKDQYIKMVYKEESYSGIPLSKFKERFEDLKLVEKEND